MKPNPMQTEVRKLVRRRRVGKGATCMLCGEADPDVLVAGKHRRIVEAHHVVGKAYDVELTGPLCLNDHRKVHVLMEEAGIDLRDDADRTLLETLVAILSALAAFFLMLGQKLREWAEALVQLIEALDANHRGWRQLPEARRR